MDHLRDAQLAEGLRHDGFVVVQFVQTREVVQIDDVSKVARFLGRGLVCRELRGGGKLVGSCAAAGGVLVESGGALGLEEIDVEYVEVV